MKIKKIDNALHLDKATTPEAREQQLRDQLLEAVKEYIHSAPEDRNYLLKQFDDPASKIHPYQWKNTKDLLFNVNEQSFKFEQQESGSAGWLGCQADEDTLLILPTNALFFSDTNAKLLLSRGILKLTPEEINGKVGDGTPIFVEAHTPAVLKSESWMAQHEPKFTREPRPGYYAVQTGGKMDMLRFVDGDRRSKTPAPDPAYASRAREKATLLRDKEKADVMHEQKSRVLAESVDQRKLLEQARVLKRAYDELEKERSKTAAWLEQEISRSSPRALVIAESERFAKLTRNQQLYLRNKAYYRLPSEHTFAALRQYREHAQQTRGEVNFFKKLTADGKAIDAYLGEVAAILSEELLSQTQTREQELKQKLQQFEKNDKYEYAQSRKEREQEATTLFTTEIEQFFDTRHARTNKYPERMEEWEKEGLWQWLETVSRTK